MLEQESPPFLEVLLSFKAPMMSGLDAEQWAVHARDEDEQVAEGLARPEDGLEHALQVLVLVQKPGDPQLKRPTISDESAGIRTSCGLNEQETADSLEIVGPLPRGKDGRHGRA